MKPYVLPDLGYGRTAQSALSIVQEKISRAKPADGTARIPQHGELMLRADRELICVDPVGKKGGHDERLVRRVGHSQHLGHPSCQSRRQAKIANHA